MKKIFFAIFAVAALASCMQDEIVSFDKGDAIAFNNAFVSNATKAAVDPSITSSTISEFVVYGTVSGTGTGEATDVNIFPGVTVKQSNTDVNNPVGDTWFYAGDYVQYWINGNNYKFAAVVNGDVTKNATTGMPATIAYTANGTTDLLFAVAGAVGKESGNSAVEFTFSHLLSKVKFSVKNNISNNTEGTREWTYRVTNVMINNAYASATYNVDTTYEFPTTGNATADQATASAWGSQTGDFVTEFGDINTEPKNATDVFVSGETFIKGTKTAESQYERLLIPGTKDLKITCKIETVLNGEVIDTNTYDKTVNVTLVKGTAYNFLIELNLPGEEIKFTVEDVGGWVQAGNVVTPDFPKEN